MLSLFVLFSARISSGLLSNCSAIHRQINMVFACQRDSFLRTLKTKVVSCKAGKLAGHEAFEITLEDTVLFPEGGGQVGLMSLSFKFSTIGAQARASSIST